MNKQQTLRESAVYSGIALHTGVRSTLRFLPCDANSGITFRRIDLPGKPEVKALASKVVDVRRGTTIGEGECVAHQHRYRRWKRRYMYRHAVAITAWEQTFLRMQPWIKL